jgi:uncharacterized protein (TIRG00374 family)
VNKYVRLLIGILISIAGLYYAFASIDWNDFITQLKDVDYFLVFISVSLMVFSVYIRAGRWRLILLPEQPIKMNPLFGSTMIGYFGNSVLPFRLGEVLRALALAVQCKLSTSTIMGTIVLERFLDMAGLILLILIFTLINPLDGWFGISFYLILIITIVALLLAFRINTKKENLSAKESKSFFQKLIGFINRVLNGFTILQRSNNKLSVILQSILLWVIYYFSMFLVVAASGLPISWSGTGVLLIATTLSIIIPAAPGYFGTYHAATIFVLTSMYNITRTESQAFAVLAHAIGFIPFVVIGAVFFIRSSISISQLNQYKFQQ